MEKIEAYIGMIAVAIIGVLFGIILYSLATVCLPHINDRIADVPALCILR